MSPYATLELRVAIGRTTANLQWVDAMGSVILVFSAKYLLGGA